MSPSATSSSPSRPRRRAGLPRTPAGSTAGADTKPPGRGPLDAAEPGPFADRPPTDSVPPGDERSTVVDRIPSCVDGVGVTGTKDGRDGGDSSAGGATYSSTYSEAGGGVDRAAGAPRAGDVTGAASSAGTTVGRRGAAARAAGGAGGGGATVIAGGGGGGGGVSGGNGVGGDGTACAARLGGADWAATRRCSVWASRGSSPSWA